ncbi:hypothetical protein D3C76_280390 [compost metagenome]
MDIFCKNDLCPICNSEMICEIAYDELEMKCKNNCYEIYKYDYITNNQTVLDRFVFYIFNKKFTLITGEDDWEIVKEILSWKQDDRYLVKIMTEG